ncbi:hypothetical protein PCASD_23350 [Puccinia coronata f. sp. avenae]|uniref:GDP/GTP exchange factor Sec2 N-terminal domain-containing protein n=1 Tax=Puccinia coronata f. sp. avenae TaxID=200324 RepID=A0A2N5S6X7_9BASI|nr:hypothetical protein PCASD_23350 [Puccinia coronata f. sp. avenae]
MFAISQHVTFRPVTLTSSPSVSSSSLATTTITQLNHTSTPADMEQTTPIQEFTEQLNQLSHKLVTSFETISLLEDQLHELRQKNNKLNARNDTLERESAQHQEALRGGLLVERANVQLELQRLSQKVTQESERRFQSEASLSTINQELDDLSASLFTEANRLVAEEKIQRIQAERKVIQVEEAMKRVEEIIEARRDQSNDLRLSLEAAERERDEFKLECETLKSQLNHLQHLNPSSSNNTCNPTSSIDSLTKSSSTGSILNSRDSFPTPLLNNNNNNNNNNNTITSLSTPHSDHHHHLHPSHSSPYLSSNPCHAALQSNPQFKLSQEVIPFTEFIQFVQYLRRTRQDVLNRSSPVPTATESFYSGTTTTSSSTRPISSTSSFLSSNKDSTPLNNPTKDLLAPFLPLTQHLTQPFLKRCVDEDSDPTLRLDLAPGLNFISRRATLTALFEGNLIIEPVWSESARTFEFENCTLCGCSLDSWLSGRDSSAVSSTSHTMTASSSGAGSAMRKMLRGGAWSFGGIGKLKRSSHPVTSTTQQVEKSSLVPSVSLRLPPSGRSSPNHDASSSSSSLHIHTFKTVDSSSTQYPICPIYCLPRLRAVCHFWTFVRSLERGVLLDETFRFSHYINPPASRRSSETHSLGLAYDQALKRIRGQNNRSVDSVDDSPSLIHSVRSSVFAADSSTPLQLPSSNQTVTDHGVSRGGVVDTSRKSTHDDCTPDDTQSYFQSDPPTDLVEVTLPKQEEAHHPPPASCTHPALETPQKSSHPVRITPRSPSPSPTSTTEHDATQEGGESNHTHPSASADETGESAAVRPVSLSNHVPILSPAPSPAHRRTTSRSPSKDLMSHLPSMRFKGDSPNDSSTSSANRPPVAEPAAVGPRAPDMLHESVPTGHGEPRPSNGGLALPLRNPPRSAPVPASSSDNPRHSRLPSLPKSHQSGLEHLDAGWEERCWHQVVKLKEEMFFKRVGISLIPN